MVDPYGNWGWLIRLGQWASQTPAGRRASALVQEWGDDAIAYAQRYGRQALNAAQRWGRQGPDAAQSCSTGQKAVSVIGPRATYRQFAQKMGASYLDVADEAWTWAKNEEFLKGIVNRGDDVLFAGKFNPARLDPNSALAREITYLIGHGYRWAADYSKLVKTQ